MDVKKLAIEKHSEWRGKITVNANAPLNNKDDLSIAYTPGVAEPCLEIQKDINKSYEYTRRWNLVAVVTDGSAVLGLGDIGPEAGMPVMEGKCLLFKEFGDIDAFPLCIRSNNVDEIVNTVKLLAGSFGGINLEDISAPRCFEIERQLKKVCDIPIFHDDQHGTAIVATAALKNALKLTGKNLDDIKVIINGPGSAGIAIGKLYMSCGVNNIIFCGPNGALTDNTPEMNSEQITMSNITNPNKETGLLVDIIKGADVFIGVSKANLLTFDMVKSMNKNPIVFAMANPVPEIMPDVAKSAGVAIIGTGRSDFPNQINNVLAFPGVFRGALDCRASDINDSMKLAAADAIADIVANDLTHDYILPLPFDKRVVPAVADAVVRAAYESGVARI